MKKLTFLIIIVLTLVARSNSQTTAFSYQGTINHNGSPPSANYDFEFKLFDAVSGGTQLGSTAQRLNVAVANGDFAVSLDFGSAGLPGADRYLDIAVRPAGGGGFTSLTPRQRITSAPYAVQSLNAANAQNLAGVAANQYVITTDPRMTDARTPLAGSTNYIRNGTSQQTATNFNIGGNGTVSGTLSGGTVNANSQYTLNGVKLIQQSVSSNLSIGADSGDVSGGSRNVYVGPSAGRLSTAGSFDNSTLGYQAGDKMEFGSNRNSLFGAYTGNSITTGIDNSFFGANSNCNIPSTTTGSGNSFFGSAAGCGTFIGAGNQTGNNNTFIGMWSGGANVSGSFNTALGYKADVTANNLTAATAIGTYARVGTSNTIVLGKAAGTFDGVSYPADTVQVPGSLTVAGALNAGAISVPTVVATTQFNIGGNRVLSTPGNSNLFAGSSAGQANTQGDHNSFIGSGAGMSNTGGDTNTFVGANSGATNTIGGRNTFVGTESGAANTTGGSNTFVGMSAGQAMTNGSLNSFFGDFAGGNNNGTANTFLGRESGRNNLAGEGNTFVGVNAGVSSTSGSSNTLVGASIDIANDVTNATAIGARAYVSQNDSLVLGGIFGVNGATANTRVGIGTTAPVSTLHVAGNARVASSNTIVQPNRGNLDVLGHSGTSNLYIQGGGPARGINFGVDSNSANNATLYISQYDGTTYNDRVVLANNGNLGVGTTTPADKLHVNGGNIRLTGGNLFIANPNTVVLTSPNGACWGLTVSNAGALSTFPTACP